LPDGGGKLECRYDVSSRLVSRCLHLLTLKGEGAKGVYNTD